MHRVSNNTCGKSVEYNTYLWEKNYFVIKFIHYSKSNYIKNIKKLKNIIIKTKQSKMHNIKFIC